MFFFFNDTATTEIYTLSLHDALPIYRVGRHAAVGKAQCRRELLRTVGTHRDARGELLARERAIALNTDSDRTFEDSERNRSEEHTSELQSLAYIVCRLLLEKKKKS